ncbi:NAD(P)/FAD-dependent oxidoreductase [Natronosalvus caseinilyticus]|uniref:NAD(P)/FAD-dependent oxidoreductase n=1 Tax=Natronosalvus caseinilyticus TaxID=2953747 RepID=UPI0028ABFA9D|nr:NAD(P)/FAD-dependent oxidoreductase [Natronosalvus caseinilyticus]
MTRTASVVVVGGGLAGLVTARTLARDGFDVTLYERRGAVGGRVRTTERDGYRLDRGFQVLFTAYPAVRAELDLPALDLREFAPGAVIARDGRRSTLSDPFRDPEGVPETLCNSDVTLTDKLGILRLRHQFAGRDPDQIFEGPDATIDQYLRDQGFSDRFIDNFAAPFYGGITLDRSLSTSKRIFEYTFRALAAGSIAVPAKGMGRIPEQLAASAESEGVAIETDTTVTAVDATDGGATCTLEPAGRRREETVDVDAVVVATDPPTARELTGVESIPTTSKGCVTQYYTLPGWTDLETGKRLLLNADDGSGPNQIVPHSAVAPAYAPNGSTLLGATYLGQLEDDVDDEALAGRTRRALESWYPDRRFDDLETVHTERIPFAQFAQPPGIHDELPGPRAPNGRCYLAGEYTRWSSIQGALESGRRAALAVRVDLEG